MKICATISLAVGIMLLPLCASAQSGCLLIADEPNHELVFQNNAVRIYRLDLPRLASTKEFCVENPYLRIVVTNGRATDLVTGEAGYTHDWHAGEARSIYTPKKKVIRNDTGSTYREYIFESLRKVEYNRFNVAYDRDQFPSDLGSAKPSWSVGFNFAGLTANKHQLAPGETITIGSPDHFIIGLTDLDLSTGAGKDEQSVDPDAGDGMLLPGGKSLVLKNEDTAPARFIVVEF